MPNVIIDPDSKSLTERFALIRSPKRSRARFPSGCVTLVEDEAAARAGASLEQRLHPALVYGPSASSEGQQVYYLVRWLS